MHLADAFRAYGASAQSALVDPFLDRDVRFGFELEVSLFPSYQLSVGGFCSHPVGYQP